MNLAIAFKQQFILVVRVIFLISPFDFHQFTNLQLNLYIIWLKNSKVPLIPIEKNKYLKKFGKNYLQKKNIIIKSFLLLFTTVRLMQSIIFLSIPFSTH